MVRVLKILKCLVVFITMVAMSSLLVLQHQMFTQGHLEHLAQLAGAEVCRGYFDDIDDAMEAIRDEDLPSARQALAEGAELCDKMREGMNHLLRTQDFTESGSRPSRRGRTSRTERPRGSIW